MLKKILTSIFLFIYIFSFYTPVAINAVERIDCEYEELNLTISYDLAENSNPSINSDFVSGTKYLNFIIGKTGTDITRTDAIVLDQTLYEKYQGGYVCPDKMYVCAQTNYSINLPTLYGLGADLLLVLTQISDLVLSLGDWVIDSVEFLVSLIPGVDWESGNDLGGWISESFKDIVEEEAYALVTFNERNLYILTESEYKKNEISDHKTRLYNDRIDIINANLEIFCTDGKCNAWYWDILNYLFADLKSGLDILIDLFTESEIVAFGYEQIDCMTVSYTGEYGKVDINCTFLDKLTFNYQDVIEEYKQCSTDSCKSNAVSKMKEIEKKMNVGCDNVLKNYLYSETQKDCVKRCLNLDVTLNEYKKGTDLYSYRIYDDSPNACNFSSRIVSWIMKIIEWIRYIVPVLLIVLSVMDFIKAVASDSEDEIRKVGSKFVKRLIVAALIFILPLLLEFLLGIFNIPINDFCLK